MVVPWLTRLVLLEKHKKYEPWAQTRYEMQWTHSSRQRAWTFQVIPAPKKSLSLGVYTTRKDSFSQRKNIIHIPFKNNYFKKYIDPLENQLRAFTKIYKIVPPLRYVEKIMELIQILRFTPIRRTIGETQCQKTRNKKSALSFSHFSLTYTFECKQTKTSFIKTIQYSRGGHWHHVNLSKHFYF